MYNFNIIIENDRKELENMLTDDSVYLLLLKYDNQKMPSYTLIAKELGCTRQTISKKVKNLIDQGLIQLGNDKIIKVKKIEEEVIITEAENDDNEIILKEYVIYGIVSEGKLKYVGSTGCLKQRIYQHTSIRPFLTRNNFIILKIVSRKERYSKERELIKALSPEWNIMSKEKE